MAKLSIQELIGEVAKRHNVLLGPNDPILVTLTLHELIVGGYVADVSTQLEGQFDQLSGATAQHVQAAKEIAQSLITRSAEYVEGRIRTTGEELANELRAAMIADVAAARKAALEAREARTWSMWFAVLAVGAAALLVGLVLGGLLHR